MIRWWRQLWCHHWWRLEVIELNPREPRRPDAAIVLKHYRHVCAHCGKVDNHG